MNDRIFFAVAGAVSTVLAVSAFLPLAARATPGPVEAARTGNALVFDVAALNRMHWAKETPIAQGPRPGQEGVRMISRLARFEGGRVATLKLGPETAAALSGRRVEVSLDVRQMADYGSNNLGLSFGGGNYTRVAPITREFAIVRGVLDVPVGSDSLRFWPDLTGGNRGVEVRSVTVKVLS